MNIYDTIMTRRSVRAYQDKPIPEEVLERLLEATRWAPSANNLQPWKLIVVHDAQKRHDLAVAAMNQTFLAQAPVVLAAVSLAPGHIMTCDVPLYPVDVSIAVDHLTLAAAAEGLGTCWIGAFRQDPVRQILDVPETCKVVILTPLGYPADEPAARTRKSIAELVCYDTFEA